MHFLLCQGLEHADRVLQIAGQISQLTHPGKPVAEVFLRQRHGQGHGLEFQCKGIRFPAEVFDKDGWAARERSVSETLCWDYRFLDKGVAGALIPDITVVHQL
jgi:hypothetical protein